MTAKSGIRHHEYGMGACAGDYDNDGLIDLYVTNVGPNVLRRNTGGGRFNEVPNAAGADSPLWSTSCAFLDMDRVGDLDLFVTNYVDDFIRRRFCGVKGPPPIRDYCHPLLYSPPTSSLYRNTGRKTFEDVSTQSGVGAHRGNGLGVAVSNVDEDGWPDVFVANDAMPNPLFRNAANGTFTETASLAEVAVASDGKARAGMGTAFADFSGSGRLGLIVTNHETEMHSLFVNVDGRLFSDATVRLLDEGGSGNAILVRVIGAKSNRSAIGTRLTLTAGQRRQVREVQSGSSLRAATAGGTAATSPTGHARPVSDVTAPLFPIRLGR